MIQGLKYGALLVTTICVIGILIWNMKIQQEVSTHQETFTTILHNIILECIEASKVIDSNIAMCKIMHAKGALETLSKLSGGDTALSRITNIDVEKTYNTLTYQERQIRKYWKYATESHPLEKETVDNNE